MSIGSHYLPVKPLITTVALNHLCVSSNFATVASPAQSNFFHYNKRNYFSVTSEEMYPTTKNLL